MGTKAFQIATNFMKNSNIKILIRNVKDFEIQTSQLGSKIKSEDVASPFLH